ncbi:mandelate racemase [Chloroflexi bacterium TSY]|nr:mandelate racemase [Chloroflexi bacterium TSY]
MQITDIELLVVERNQNDEVVVLTVKTDEGIDGQAMAWGHKGGRRVAEDITAVIKPELIGQNPINREYLYHKIVRADRWGGHMSITAHGPIDVALRDIAAKKAGLPLYQFIGGYRDKIMAYTTGPRLPEPDDHVQLALKAQEQGFKGFKLHTPGDADLDIACCRAVRQALGDDFILMCDPVAAYDHEDALRVGRALEKLNFFWYEEPLHDYDIHGYIQLAQTLDIPIAGVEWAAGSYHMAAEYIVRGAVDIVRSDVSWKGGITGYLKTAHLCEAFGLNCEAHLAVYSLLNVANLHAACGIRNCRFLELSVNDDNFGITPGLTVDDEGYVHAPQAPGLGVELDWAAITPRIKARL